MPLVCRKDGGVLTACLPGSQPSLSSHCFLPSQRASPCTAWYKFCIGSQRGEFIRKASVSRKKGKSHTGLSRMKPPVSTHGSWDFTGGAMNICPRNKYTVTVLSKTTLHVHSVELNAKMLGPLAAVLHTNSTFDIMEASRGTAWRRSPKPGHFRGGPELIFRSRWRDNPLSIVSMH